MTEDEFIYCVEHFKEIMAEIDARKNHFDRDDALKALSLCLYLPEDLTDDPCKRCPYCQCDPEDQLKMVRSLLIGAADERAQRLASVLDLCLEYDEESCESSCPYYDRCRNDDILVILQEVYDYLKEAGAYG